MRLQKPVIIAYALLASFLLSCSSGDSTPDELSLRCEEEGYPCTLAEVDAAVLSQSDTLAQEALSRIENGETPPDTATWLLTNPSVVDAKSSEVALFFRLDGGRPHWVLSDDAFADIPSFPPAARTKSQPRQPKDVVGDDPKEKRALVLSPYQWEFGSWDDGQRVAEILSETRGYEDNVVFKANSEKDSRTIKGSDLKNWNDFDVVHVSSHGVQICEGGECYTVLLSGAMTEEEITTRGVSIATSAIGNNFGATDDLFKSVYPRGLGKTIVFFNACETLKGNDFANVFSRASGVYLGWTESVDSDIAYKAALSFYKELGENGRTTQAAHEEVQDQGLHFDVSDGAELLRVQAGDDLRAREILTAYDPDRVPSEGSEWQDGSVVRINGAPNDGDPDKLPFVLDIDGVESGVDEIQIHVSVNGEEATRSWYVSEATMVETYTYRLTAEAEFDTDFDDTEGLDVVFWATLPEQGESRLELNVGTAAWNLKIAGPYFSEEFSGSIATLRDFSPSAFQFTFESEPDEEGLGLGPPSGITYRGALVPGDNQFVVEFESNVQIPNKGAALFAVRNVPNAPFFGVGNSEEMCMVRQPDDTVFICPGPPTLRVFDYDPEAATVRGRLEGPHYSCYVAVDVGPSGYCDAYDVTLDFNATIE
jgi:hypothetical protein